MKKLYAVLLALCIALPALGQTYKVQNLQVLGTATIATPLPIASGGTNAATATGATSQLRYLQGTTGSVERTLTNKLRDTVNAKDYGVVCDGVTDDAANLQAAEDSFGAAGGVLILPSGTCKINSTLTIAATSGANANITIIGSKNGTQITPGASMMSLFTITGKNVTIAGVFFNNASSFATNGISFVTPSSDAGFSGMLRENTFIGFTNGISVAGQNYNITGNFFQNNTTHLLFTDDGRNTSINDNYFLGDNVGIRCKYITYQAEGLRILNNTLLITAGGGAGIYLEAGLEIYVGANIIDQTGTGSPAVYMAPGANTIAKIKLIGNWLAAGQNSYSIFANGNNSDLAIISNSIMSNNGLAATNGISLTNTNGYQVIGNNFGIVNGGDLSTSGEVNGTVIGNTSSQGGSNVLLNSFSQAINTRDKVTASSYVVGGASQAITAGVGVPTAALPNGSLYLRLDGGTGGRLYVSAGSGVWNPVTGV